MLAVRMPNPACDARSTALAKMHAMPTDTPTDLPDTNIPHRIFSDNENEKSPAKQGSLGCHRIVSDWILVPRRWVVFPLQAPGDPSISTTSTA
jgi:hypothetical protein